MAIKDNTVKRDVDGKTTLEVINDKINIQEGAGGEFVDSKPDQDRSMNVVKFKRLPAGQRPAKRIKFIKKGESPPQDTEKIWTGKEMIVKGKLEEVEAYR